METTVLREERPYGQEKWREIATFPELRIALGYIANQEGKEMDENGRLPDYRLHFHVKEKQ